MWFPNFLFPLSGQSTPRDLCGWPGRESPPKAHANSGSAGFFPEPRHSGCVPTLAAPKSVWPCQLSSPCLGLLIYKMGTRVYLAPKAF